MLDFYLNDKEFQHVIIEVKGVDEYQRMISRLACEAEEKHFLKELGIKNKEKVIEMENNSPKLEDMDAGRFHRMHKLFNGYL